MCSYIYVHMHILHEHTSRERQRVTHTYIYIYTHLLYMNTDKESDKEWHTHIHIHTHTYFTWTQIKRESQSENLFAHIHKYIFIFENLFARVIAIVHRLDNDNIIHLVCTHTKKIQCTKETFSSGGWSAHTIESFQYSTETYSFEKETNPFGFHSTKVKE